MLVLPVHPTPIACRTHTSDPVPYMLYDSTDKNAFAHRYNEAEARLSGNETMDGYTLIDYLLENK